MFKELKKSIKNINKAVMKKNKNETIIFLLLLVTIVVFTYKMPTLLIKPLYNRIVNLGLIISIIINYYCKNYLITSVLLISLVIINMYGMSKKQKNNVDNYDNSIFSHFRKNYSDNLEHMTSENDIINTLKNTLKNIEKNSEKISDQLENIENKSEDISEELKNIETNTKITLESSDKSENKDSLETEKLTKEPTETFANFMNYELFKVQNNTVPESTKIDNDNSPVIGINEYCTQGNTLNNDMPIGYDIKCKMNCSSI